MAKAPASQPRLVRAGAVGGGPARSSAPFAVTSDSALLINIDALDAIDAERLEGRAFFIGAELAEGERQLAHELLDGAGHELRSKIVWTLAAPRAPKRVSGGAVTSGKAGQGGGGGGGAKSVVPTLCIGLRTW
jgi:hypothetical protein